ncbi:MAG: sterol desaturase family protein [Pseudomonadota bacterium]
MDFLLENEPTIRLSAFLSIFAAMALFEIMLPRRRPEVLDGAPVKGRRWFSHGSLVIIDSLVLRLVFPAAAVGTAHYASVSGIGLFNAYDIPLWLAALIAFIILDFAVWLEHWASHKIPLLWRIHRMHHADTDFDVTTALRFHPLEIVLSMVWKAAIVIALGAPVVAVLVFEIVLNGMAMFNHSNAKLPLWLDRIIRIVFVTPDMHRVHHSSDQPETDSNYGFNFSFWDRLFKTYTPEPALGHEGMQIGLKNYRGKAPSTLTWNLTVPFKALARPKSQKISTGK